ERIRGELVEFERLRHAGRLAGDDQRLTQILTGYACEIGARHEHSRAVREHERLRGARRRTVQSLDGATRRLQCKSTVSALPEDAESDEHLGLRGALDVSGSRQDIARRLE